jgi:acyl-coenzyme A synthetase/AMP-(fatty) acid ligase
MPSESHSPFLHITNRLTEQAVPLAIAAPAAVASLAYLNARTQFSHDVALIKSLVKNALVAKSLEKKDRVNTFYRFEGHALDKKTANSTFLVYQDSEWTYKEAYDIVLKYAAWLKTKYGVAPHEVVALDFMNSPKFLFIWLALWSLGACPAFINYNLTSEPLLHCINTSTGRIVFVDDEVKHQFSDEVLGALRATNFRNGKGSVEVVYLDEATERDIENLEGYREPDLSRSGDLMHTKAMLIYTSGTTGNPKAAIVPWSKTHVGAVVFENWMGMKQSDRFYTVPTSL